jgi:hypothetical protein
MKPVGYAGLIAQFGLEVLVPDSRSYVLERVHRRSAGRFDELTDEEVRRMEAVVRRALSQPCPESA